MSSALLVCVCFSTSLHCREDLWAQQAFPTTCVASSGSECSSTPVEPCKLIFSATSTAFPSGGTWDARLVSVVRVVEMMKIEE